MNIYDFFCEIIEKPPIYYQRFAIGVGVLISGNGFTYLQYVVMYDEPNVMENMFA